MKTIPLRIVACATFVTALAAPALAAQPGRYKTDVPPSAELDYAIQARQRGFVLDGSAQVRWQTSGKNFTIVTETRSKLFGRIMEARTEGVLDAQGLAPLRFDEKRLGKPATATTFDRKAGVIRFSASDASYPIKGGEQDRNSVVWQLISVARAAKSRFKPGSEWTFFVAGSRNGEPWTFKVIGQEKVSTPMGELPTLLVRRLPTDDKDGQQLDIWLAPSRNWYPVRLRFVEEDGDSLDQVVTRIEALQSGVEPTSPRKP